MMQYRKHQKVLDENAPSQNTSNGMKLFVETFGCQMNLADSEEMIRYLSKRGFALTDKKEEAHLLLLNTCTVRQHAEDRALSYIGRLKNWKKKNSNRKLIVTGCAAERLKESLQKRFPFIDLVVGAKSIEEFPKMVDELMASHFPNTLSRQSEIPLYERGIVGDRLGENDNFNWFEESENSFEIGQSRDSGAPLVLGENGKTTFITIMRGCNYSCSYCIVPAVRGREIYRPVEEILSEIREKTSHEEKEIMLLGQTVNSYWYRWQTANGKWQMADFSDLLQLVEEIKGVREIRFMSPHPHYMSEKLIRTIAEGKKISPKIHLPVQSGSNAILKAMKRNYTREQYIEIVSKLRKAKPSLELTTDFIVGFPGETEEDFQATLSLIDEVGFHSAFCFKYSARQGTEAAATLDDLPLTVKEERLDRLMKTLKSSSSSPLLRSTLSQGERD